MEKELSAFLQWLKPLLDLDTTETEPLLYSHQEDNVLREDKPEGRDLQKLQAAASNFEDGFYRVPSVIE